MGRVSRRVLLVGGWSVLGVPVLAACLGGGGGRSGGSAASGGAGTGSAGASASASGSAGASGGSGQGVTRTVSTEGASVEVTVGPAVVSNDVMVVPLAAHLDKAGAGASSSSSDKKFEAAQVWNGTGSFTGADGVRLVDFDAGTVQETFKASSESVSLSDKEPDGVVHALFKPVEGGSVNVLVPESGLFEGVPVVRDGTLSEEAKKALEYTYDTGSTPDPVALETFTASVDGASDTRVTGKSVVINLASDVLFDSDSADLSAQADTTLKKAADQLSTYPAGEVTIVGHTDDVADDAHNQDLSQRRAQAVSDRLGQLTSMSAYSVSVSGKGEGEPRVPNDSDENRQLNRRVEITLVPTQESSTKSDAGKDAGQGGDLPKAEGPVAKGGEEVTVKRGSGEDKLTFVLKEVTRRGKYLVGEVQATGGPGGTDVGPSDWLQPTQLAGSARGEEDTKLLGAITGLSLLTAQTRYYPVDYATAQGGHHPLSEITADNKLGDGDATTLIVVWPDTGQDTVTLDLEPSKRPTRPNNPFRITDIPVKG
ncbi:OmpA family protein [Actinomyces sp. ZJ308]|uniref:OmpA family protein n=1 Tax=Actinomyces sp. ZJ308 TaxID=2708342 RepID=UPI001420BB23|nr:OmpA family protein [Actinomyces sp. ZJ308]